MSDAGGPRHPEHGHRRRWLEGAGMARPPWWPEGEPFPPSRRPEWGRRRNRFLRRVLVTVLAIVAATTAAVYLAVWLVGNVVGATGAAPGVRLASAAALLLLALLLTGGGRVFRRAALPVADLVEAAGRIEAGDLAVRVPERGPRSLRAVARAFNAMTERLQATDARRRTFLAEVSHELRTPLAVIRGRAEGIVEGVYPGDAAHVAPILESAHQLEVLIDDLRTLALADAGGLALRREPIDLALLLRETLAAFDAEAQAAGVRLEPEIAGGPTIDADPARLRSAVANLLGNAIRHTPSGGRVVVSMRPTGSEIEVTVTDTGEGIPPDLLPHVFERFTRGPGSTGSGLGLAIARDLVVAHGGRIEAESRPGEGTAMRLWLPA